MSRHRRLADLPLVALLALGGLFTAGLVALLAGLSLPHDPLAACASMAATVAARLTTLGIVAPAGILSVVLLAGVLAVAHQLWVTHAMLRGVLGRRRPVPERLQRAAEAAGVGGRVDVVRDDGAFVFCYGYLRPRVCLSTAVVGLLDDDELTAVLRHEAHHARHRDPLKILAGRAVASALFFVPLAGALRNRYLAGKEICADRAAQDGSGGVALPGALMKLLGAERPTWPAGVLAIGSLSPTEARIHNLLAPEDAQQALPPPMDWILSLALIAGIFGFSYGSAAAHQGPVIHDSCNNPTAYALR